jgi:hypothetical protein
MAHIAENSENLNTIVYGEIGAPVTLSNSGKSVLKVS